MTPKCALIIAIATFCTGLLLGFAVQGKLGSTDVLKEPDQSASSQLLHPFAQSCLAPLNQNTAQLVRLNQRIDSLAASVRQHAAPSSRPASASADVAPAPDLRVLQQELVQLIQHEFDVIQEAIWSKTDRADPPATEAPTDLPAAISPEANRAAFEATYDVVSHALASGRWTDEDVMNLRQHLGALTEAQQAEVFQLLLPAINNGVIAVETTGPIF